MTAVLTVDSLSRHFGAIKAVDNISFALQRGELLAMIGPNGAGKSTCFNMLMGQLKPTSGSVKLKGKGLIGLAPRRIWRMGVGRTFQITQTYASMTVIENVQMALLSFHNRIYGLLPFARNQYREEATVLLETVGMAEQADRHCAILAYGDLKRLELAVALANDPMLLLMDEPTAGMAPRERVALMQLTADIVRERQVSVLFTEHDMDVVFAHSHRIMVMNRGRMIANGSVDEIRNNPQVQEVYLGGGTLYHDTPEGAAHA